MNIHGNADSHIDALCHVIFDGKLYNGVPAETVTETGAAELSIGLAADGIVGRGVLLDVPRSRGVPWLEPGDHVTADDLFAAERDQGIRAGRATSSSCGSATACGGPNWVRGMPPRPGPGCTPPCWRWRRSVRSLPWAATGTMTPRPVPSMA